MNYKLDLFVGTSTKTIPKNNCLEVLTFEEIFLYVIQVCDLSNFDFDIHLPFTVQKHLINNVLYSYSIIFNNKQEISLVLDIEEPYTLLTNLNNNVNFTPYIRDKKLKELLK